MAASGSSYLDACAGLHWIALRISGLDGNGLPCADVQKEGVSRYRGRRSFVKCVQVGIASHLSFVEKSAFSGYLSDWKGSGGTLGYFPSSDQSLSSLSLLKSPSIT